MIFRPAMFALVTILASASAHAMCGGGMTAKSDKTQTAGRNQCGGGMGAMEMAAKPDAATSPDAAKAADPHAGMDMGDGKTGEMAMGCCGCCKMGGGSKTGGMCGQQANAVTEDGKNDPLLTDPMWNKSKKYPQSVAPVQP